MRSSSGRWAACPPFFEPSLGPAPPARPHRQASDSVIRAGDGIPSASGTSRRRTAAAASALPWTITERRAPPPRRGREPPTRRGGVPAGYHRRAQIDLDQGPRGRPHGSRQRLDPSRQPHADRLDRPLIGQLPRAVVGHDLDMGERFLGHCFSRGLLTVPPLRPWPALAVPGEASPPGPDRRTPRRPRTPAPPAGPAPSGAGITLGHSRASSLAQIDADPPRPAPQPHPATPPPPAPAGDLRPRSRPHPADPPSLMNGRG